MALGIVSEGCCKCQTTLKETAMFDLQSPPNQDGRTCSTVFPVKGCFPESNKKVMTPMLQVLGRSMVAGRLGHSIHIHTLYTLQGFSTASETKEFGILHGLPCKLKNSFTVGVSLFILILILYKETQRERERERLPESLCSCDWVATL